MPVVPSFRGYAETPNLASAFLGGQNIQLGRERLAQEAASDAARIALGRQQLQAQQVANEMEWAARKDIAAREAMQKAQEAEIEQSYRQTQLGLMERRLRDDEAITQMKLQEAASGFEREQRYSRLQQQHYLRRKAAGEPEDEARRNSAADALYEVGGTGVSSAFGATREPSALPEFRFRYQFLQDQIKELARPYQGDEAALMPDTVKDQIAELRRQQGMLAPLQSPAMGTTTNLTPAITQPSMIPPMPGQVPSGTQIPPMIGQIYPPTTNAPDNEVIRRTKDGRRAVFDATTKRFLRYAQ